MYEESISDPVRMSSSGTLINRVVPGNDTINLPRATGTLGCVVPRPPERLDRQTVDPLTVQ